MEVAQRTQQEIEETILALQKVVDETPDVSGFGDSNVDEKNQLRGWIVGLNRANDTVKGGGYPEKETGSWGGEVNAWLWNDFSIINDYLI